MDQPPMAENELDKINRLAEYLNWALAEMQRETGSKLAGTRAGELLGNAAAAAQELLSVLRLSPPSGGTDEPNDEPSTLH